MLNSDAITYYRLTPQAKDRILRNVKAVLSEFENVLFAYVFGGFVRRDSVRDLDVAVYACPGFSFDEFLDLGVKLELKLDMPVDVVPLHEAAPSFRFNILRTGIPVLVRDEVLSCRILAQTFSELEDERIRLKFAK